MSTRTHYEVLGVSRQAPLHIIKATHRAWMKEIHPDSGANGDVVMAATVNEAYRVLSNPQERERYDAELTAGQPANDGSGTDADVGNVTDAEPDVGWGTEQDVGWDGEQDFPENLHPSSRQATYPSNNFADEDPSRLAGYNVFDREPINLKSMEWYGKDYEQPVASGMRLPMAAVFRRSIRFWAWIAFALLALTCLVPGFNISFVEPRTDGWVLNLLIYVVALPALTLFLGHARARRRGGRVRYIIAMLLVGWFSWYLADSNRGPEWMVPLGWLVLFMITVELFRASSSFRNQPISRRLSREDFVKFNTWGNPGGAISQAQGTYSQRNLSAGIIGEIMTGQLLSQLVKIPGTKIMHGLVFPGSANADVDHAVLCGNRLALVDSKHWRSGDYYWLGTSMLFARPREQPQITWSNFPTAVAAYQQQFPKLEVRGWYVLHSNDGGTIRTNNREAGDKPPLLTPEPFLQEIGNWLAEGVSRNADRKQLSRLVFGFMKAS